MGGGETDCDYPKCPHKDTSFRKDHCREHYREYHNEDLIKRGNHKPGKPSKPEKDKKSAKRNAGRPQTVEEFLATRRNVDLSWWRCTKCVQRVKVNSHRYTCPRCNVACEPERVAWRKKALESSKNSQVEDSPSGFSPEPTDYVMSCGQCQNAWLPDKDDMTLWISCPTCQPGARRTMRF
jgi:Zn finger protein HypA/HybF involved in hydrogenase expression